MRLLIVLLCWAWVDALAATTVVPASWNGLRTSVLRDRPVILPAQEAAGTGCDTATYDDMDWDGTVTTGTYSCIDGIPTTGHAIAASATINELNNEINDPANGNVFLIDVTGDWSTSGSALDLRRTDTSDANPLWLLPSDIATRTQGPWIDSSAVLPAIRLRCDGVNAGVGVDGVRIIGLEVSQPSADQLIHMSYPATCSTRHDSDGTVVAWNYVHDWGDTTGLNGIEVRGTNVVVVNNHIRNWQRWYSLSNQEQDMDGIRLSAHRDGGPYYVARNYIRDVSGDHIVVTPASNPAQYIAIEHNTLEWGPESRMDNDGRIGGPLATLNPDGLYIGGENCLDLKFDRTGDPAAQGVWVRGNVCVGQRRNRTQGGSSGAGSGAAIDISSDGTGEASDVRIHGNFLVDIHTRCVAESVNSAQDLDITGNVCEMNANGVYSTATQLGGIFSRFSESRVAFNTVVCRNGPGISGLVDSKPNDVKYNVVIDCDSATANHNSTPCTGCLVENILRNTPNSTADSNATIDNDATAYGDFAFYLDHPHFADAAVTGQTTPRIYTLTGVVPPVGGTAATAVPSPTFTSGYGTVYPVLRWYNQVVP